jgi:chemotaxis signal transduction protein
LSAPPISMDNSDRLLTFEVGGHLYALPIASVLEVAESDRVCCVPSLPMICGGVMNWNGDALPIVTLRMLISVADDPNRAETDGSTEHVLVVADASGQHARLGLPVERVLGLVEGKNAPLRGRNLVAERRPVDGRVVSVLDPGHVVARAVEVIEQSVN